MIILNLWQGWEVLDSTTIVFPFLLMLGCIGALLHNSLTSSITSWIPNTCNTCGITMLRLVTLHLSKCLSTLASSHFQHEAWAIGSNENNTSHVVFSNFGLSFSHNASHPPHLCGSAKHFGKGSFDILLLVFHGKEAGQANASTQKKWSFQPFKESRGGGKTGATVAVAATVVLSAWEEHRVEVKVEEHGLTF
ncbi:hypothetical protein Tco_1522625 [Tanacetum coccineum]